MPKRRLSTSGPSDSAAVERLAECWERIWSATHGTDHREFEALVQQWEPLRARDPAVIPVDLLSPMGSARHEPSHTQVIGYLLDPSGDHGLLQRPLDGLLSALGLPTECTSGADVDYLKKVTSSSDHELLLTYVTVGTQCVLDTISLFANGTVQQLAKYTYFGPEAAGYVGRLESARSPLGPSTTRYEYDAGSGGQELEIYDNDIRRMRLGYAGRTIGSFDSPYEYGTIRVSRTDGGTTTCLAGSFEGSLGCDPQLQIVEMTVPDGTTVDGTATETLKHTYRVQTHRLQPGGVITRVDQQGAGGGFSAWQTEVVLDGGLVNKAIQSPFGWTVFTNQPFHPPGGLEPQIAPIEVVSGASSAASTTGAVKEAFGYALSNESSGFQLLPTSSSRASVLDNQFYVRRSNEYESGTSHVEAATVAGRTQLVDGTVTRRILKTFFNTQRRCVEAQDKVRDVYGRTVEVIGPCEVDSEAATTCRLGEKNFSVTHTYFGTGGNAANRLVEQIAFATTSSDGVNVTCQRGHSTRTLEYDHLGRVLKVQDPNGIETTSVYEGAYLTSVVAKNVGGATLEQTTFAYEPDLGKVTRSKSLRSGAEEVLCYREGAQGDECPLTGTLTPLLQWKLTRVGSEVLTRVNYTYSRGMLASETVSSGPSASRRVIRVRKYGRDGKGRVTFDQTGEGEGQAAIRSMTYFQNGVATGSGIPYNVPLPLCYRGGDPNCAYITRDALSRPVGVTKPVSPSTQAETWTEYDGHGNIAAVTTLETDENGDYETTTLSYRHDDFGNVVGRTAYYSGGEARAEYDSSGRVVKERSPLSGVTVYTSYDALGRVTSVASDANGTLAAFKTWYDRSFDTTIDATAASCSAGTGAMGRVQVTEDSLGRHWYVYDEQGQVTLVRRQRRLGTGFSPCGEPSTEQTPNTRYEYDGTGTRLLKMTYPHGREVFYGYGADGGTPRLTTIETNETLANGGLRRRTLIKDIEYEADGQIRSYEIVTPDGGVAKVEYHLGGDSTVAMTSCASGEPSLAAGDKSGRPKALWVSTGEDGAGSGDIFKRSYAWSADQVVREDTCLLTNSATVPTTIQYVDRRGYGEDARGYDRLTRLRHASAPENQFFGGTAGTGGPFGRRDLKYSANGDVLAETASCACFAYSYAAGNPVGKSLSRSSGTAPGSSCACSALAPGGQLAADYSYAFTYDTLSGAGEGRRASKSWPKRYSGAPDYYIRWNSTPNASYGVPGSGYTSIEVNDPANTYQYWYDAAGRRRLKVHPVAGIEDEYFYSGTQLLEDRGHADVSGQAHIIDEYIWLGGRPVVLIKSRFDAEWGRLPELEGGLQCPRVGGERTQSAPCGFYFPIVDFLGKPVVALDWKRLVAGAYDYDVSGHMNRVVQPGATPKDYAEGTKYLISMYRQPPVVGKTRVDLRVRVGLNDPGTDDEVLLTGVGGIDRLPPLDPRDAQDSGMPSVWTRERTSAWFKVPDDGIVQVRFTSGTTNDLANGVIVEGYDYRRYQVGAAVLTLPLRFPGQYHDVETDVFENWNRFYDPNTMRYLSTDPALRAPSYAAGAAWGLQPYSYASSNPITGSDPDGLLPLRYAKPLVGYSFDVASGFQPTFKDLLNECNGGRGLASSCIATVGYWGAVNQSRLNSAVDKYMTSDRAATRQNAVRAVLQYLAKHPKTAAIMNAYHAQLRELGKSVYIETNVDLGGKQNGRNNHVQGWVDVDPRESQFAVNGYGPDGAEIPIGTTFDLVVAHELGHLMTGGSIEGALLFENALREIVTYDVRTGHAK